MTWERGHPSPRPYSPLLAVAVPRRPAREEMERMEIVMDEPIVRGMVISGYETRQLPDEFRI